MDGPVCISTKFPDPEKLVQISNNLNLRQYSFYGFLRENSYIQDHLRLSLDELPKLKKNYRLSDYCETIDWKIRLCQREYIHLLYYFGEGVYDRRCGSYQFENGEFKNYMNVIPREVSGMDESEEYTNYVWFIDSVEKYLYQFYSSYNLIYFLVNELFESEIPYKDSSSDFRKKIIQSLKQKGINDLAELLNEFYQKYESTVFDWRNSFVHYQNPFKVLTEDTISFCDTRKRIKEFSMIKVKETIDNSWKDLSELCKNIEKITAKELKELK